LPESQKKKKKKKKKKKTPRATAPAPQPRAAPRARPGDRRPALGVKTPPLALENVRQPHRAQPVQRRRQAYKGGVPVEKKPRKKAKNQKKNQIQIQKTQHNTHHTRWGQHRHRDFASFFDEREYNKGNWITEKSSVGISRFADMQSIHK
jgi:hypothetical protein